MENSKTNGVSWQYEIGKMNVLRKISDSYKSINKINFSKKINKFEFYRLSNVEQFFN